MVVKIAEKKEISLSKSNIEKLLDKNQVKEAADYIPFDLKYKAFSKELRTKYGVDMPQLSLLGMRRNVLH